MLALRVMGNRIIHMKDVSTCRVYIYSDMMYMFDVHTHTYIHALTYAHKYVHARTYTHTHIHIG